MKEKHNFLRMLSLWVGAELITAGCLCLAKPQAALFTFSALLGVTMLTSGILGLVGLSLCKDAMEAPGLARLQSAGAVLLGAAALLARIFAPGALPLIFAAWLLISGACRIARAARQRRLSARGWGLRTALSFAQILCGLLTLTAPFAAWRWPGVPVGAGFAAAGLGALGGRRRETQPSRTSGRPAHTI